MDEGEEDEADEGPYWRKNKHDSFQQLVDRPPDSVQAHGEDGAPVGHGGVVLGGTFTAAPDSEDRKQGIGSCGGRW